MTSIQHTFHIDASLERVYTALTSIEELAGWWTSDTVGGNELGDSIFFTFGNYATFEFQIALLNPGKLVSWKFLGGNPDWDGTYVTFVLSENEGKVMIEFVHETFSKNYANIGNINFTWAGYLTSLRNLCEIGEGQPFQ